MNTSKLRDLLNTAKQVDFPKRKMDESLAGTAFERAIWHFEKLDHPVHKELLTLLQGEFELELFNGKAFCFIESASSVDYSTLLRWMLYEISYNEIDDVIERLMRYLKLDYTPANEIAVISGLEVNESIVISDELKIVPFSELSTSFAKDAFSPPSFVEGSPVGMGLRYYNYPKAAVIKNIKLSPKTSDINQWKSSGRATELEAFCDLLIFIAPTVSPFISGYWCELEDWMPCFGLLPEGYSGSPQSITRGNGHIMSVDEIENVKVLFEQYHKLTPQVKKKLRVPLSRLNQSRRENFPVDRAIDIGIAYESFFMNDRGSGEQISYTFRLRAAWYLVSNANERPSKIKIFREIYNLRSKAVHEGQLNTEVIRIDGKTYSIIEFFELAAQLLIDAIKKVLSEGSFPNWDELVLG